ncbi:hypothetical protein E2C01_079523 [Portunus trituberculatus]|uniref:Uncharacterized protein n=1 Tax=Portunus trituberculatus TaxID=210409 RepID=A0A5B7IX37_PORTR|nr:hypothetical protein [Portunus trituberculatus]
MFNYWGSHKIITAIITTGVRLYRQRVQRVQSVAARPIKCINSSSPPRKPPIASHCPIVMPCTHHHFHHHHR